MFSFFKGFAEMLGFKGNDLNNDNHDDDPFYVPQEKLIIIKWVVEEKLQ